VPVNFEEENRHWIMLLIEQLELSILFKPLGLHKIKNKNKID
jgi:hypothetical protein